MPNFEIRNIDAVNGKQKFYKLIKDGICQIDDFENDLEEAYKPELRTIYAYMDQVANLRSLPQTKFHFYDKAKGGYREFEFKSKHLRVYGIVIDEGKLVILGGTKANQDNDTAIFRRIKKRIYRINKRIIKWTEKNY
ncbi:hypothetical protein [Bacteroides sp.]|uniref:hypothetical protein n=1 Tax=Bacteroides sp. TaxID=29523 RepID=UPI0025C3651B|nr:hypothetical protein [Bacteroides sp.]